MATREMARHLLQMCRSKMSRSSADTLSNSFIFWPMRRVAKRKGILDMSLARPTPEMSRWTASTQVSPNMQHWYDRTSDRRRRDMPCPPA